MIGAVAGAGFLAVMLMALALGRFLRKSEVSLEERLQSTAGVDRGPEEVDELKRPLWERMGKPLLKLAAARVMGSLPAKQKADLQLKLTRAGNPGGVEPYEYMAIKFTLALTGPVIFLILNSLAGLGRLSVILAAITGLIGLKLPDCYLRLRINQRKKMILRSLPEVLDILTISVQAGLGFDAALAKVVEKMQGPLPQEMLRMLQEIKMGKPRRDAMRDLAMRCDVDDLSTLMGSLIQADQLGISIGGVMKVQSGQTRMKRRQRAEEKAMKAPVKMLIPLVFFIFPSIFIVLLGPAVIQIMNAFK